MNKLKVTTLGLWSSAHIGETPSFLIESDRGNILLDMCPGVVRQLKRIGFSLANLDVAFGSHVHSDHLSGAPYLTFQHMLETRGFSESKPITFCGTTTVLNTIDSALKLYYPERSFRHDSIVVADTGISTFERDGIKFIFAKGNHTVDVAAIRIEIDGYPSVCYTSDGFFTEDIYTISKDVDLLIGEAFGTYEAMKNRYQTIMHSLGIHLGDLASKSNVKNVIPFHMGFQYNKEENRRKLLEEIGQKYSGNIIWAGEDLFSITI